MGKKQNIVVFGCSGHAKVVLDALRDGSEYNIVGLIGQMPAGDVNWFGFPVLGQDDDLPELLQRHNISGGIIAIGDNAVRRRVSEEIITRCPEFSFVSAIHPSAHFGSGVEIGAGTFIAAGSTVCADARIGPHVVINTNASVDHDSVLETAVFIGPNAALGGNVHLETEAFVGIGASVIQGVRIGTGAVVGAGAAVLSDIPKGVLAVGVPARVK